MNFRAIAVALSCAATLYMGAASAEEMRVYGVTLPAFRGGGFQPAGTTLSCAGFDKNSRCWDGTAWHDLYPAGPRKFALAKGQVDCVIVSKETSDCWDGRAWYKLPVGTVYGVILPAQRGGAFRTTPLPPDAER